jgi:hypothetical protein
MYKISTFPYDSIVTPTLFEHSCAKERKENNNNNNNKKWSKNNKSPNVVWETY